jgi:hypothetical protein
MTEEQIERRVEVMTDSLDRRFLAGTMPQFDYDCECDLIKTWAANQYALLNAGAAA